MSKRLFPLGVACFVLALLCALPARAQFGALEGDVKDVEGNPLVGAIVSIDRTDIKGHYQVKTDKKGHYYHGGLPLGTFRVTLKQGEQTLMFFDNIRLRLGEPQTINFDLKAEKQRQEAVQAGVISSNAPARPGQAEAPRLSKEQLAKIQEEQKKRDSARQKVEQLNTKFGSGMEALRTKNCDQAVTDLSAAAEMDTSQHVVFANLGEAYVCQSRSKSGDERKQALAKAQESYQKAIALKPDDASYHNNFGLALATAGMVAEAQAELNKATQLDPTNAGRYFYNLGAVLTNTGKNDEAAEAFRNAIKADPNYADAHYQLGIALSGKALLDPKTGKIIPVPGTLEEFQKYLELQPSGPYAQAAKDLMQQLGGTLETVIKPKPASQRKK